MANWFTKVVGGIVKGVKVASPFLATAATLGVPGVGIGLAISNAVLRAQAQFPAPGSGESKAEFVIGQFDEALADVKAIAEASGKLVTYDAALVRQASDAQVAAYKLTADAVASIKIVDKPKA